VRIVFAIVIFITGRDIGVLLPPLSRVRVFCMKSSERMEHSSACIFSRDDRSWTPEQSSKATRISRVSCKSLFRRSATKKVWSVHRRVATRVFVPCLVSRDLLPCAA